MNSPTKKGDGWRFDFLLTQGSTGSVIGLRNYDEATDDVRSLLKDVCVVLKSRGAQFIVSSPEAGDWPVDVETDLPIAMEQIPKLLRFLKNDGLETFELDLYEQGIQRRIELRILGHMLEVTSFCYGDSPATERSTCEVGSWRQMISGFLNKFCAAVTDSVPAAAEHPWWKQWLDAT